MIDQFGRTVRYLRVSVTDKCNLRCVYCMPLEGLDWLKREEILTYEEIAEVVRTMAGMGLERVRITGGEPLIRRDLSDLVKMIADVPEIEDLSLSTNAVLLADQAEALKQAGVQRLNISLDSLQADRVDAISRRPGSYSKIMEGLDAAEEVGFAPLKINVVLIRGQNDDEIEDFARITRERPWHIRFIELMPTGANLDLSANSFVSRRRTASSPQDRTARASGRSVRERPRHVLSIPRCSGNGWGHHADEPQLLRPVQSHAADCLRAATSVPLRRHRDQPARPTARWAGLAATHRRNAPHQAGEALPHPG